jgi:hypothetical protein
MIYKKVVEFQTYEILLIQIDLSHLNVILVI